MTAVRPYVGPALLVLGAGHTALTGVLHRRAVLDVARTGVVDALRSDPATAGERGLAFWFATAGLGMLGAGVVVTELERRAEPLPRTLPWVLVGVGAWGATLLPRSPFWALAALGVVAEARRRPAA